MPRYLIDPLGALHGPFLVRSDHLPLHLMAVYPPIFSSPSCRQVSPSIPPQGSLAYIGFVPGIAAPGPPSGRSMYFFWFGNSVHSIPRPSSVIRMICYPCWDNSMRTRLSPTNSLPEDSVPCGHCWSSSAENSVPTSTVPEAAANSPMASERQIVNIYSETFARCVNFQFIKPPVFQSTGCSLFVRTNLNSSAF